MVLNQEQFDAFRMEIATFGNIPILSQYCGIGCVFCKVHTDSYLGHYPKIPMIDKEDLIKGFAFINPNVNYVRLGAGVLVAPHTDPFLHPQIYDFIKIASEYFPTKKITTVTTGAYIREDKLDFLNSIPNFGIDLSLITMQGKREAIIPRSERERTMTLLKYAPLNKCTLMFTGSIYDIQKDLELLYGLGVDKKVRQILVRRMEHTKTSQRQLKELSTQCIEHYEECIIQIGNNLLSNAIKFTEEGGVSLTTDYNNGILTLVVEDTGTGMTQEEQQQVFGAFERLSNAAAKDGFGLGLAIVKNIVTMLSGKIHLESEKGKGSRFTVEIPMSKAEEVLEKEIQTYIHREDRNLNVIAIDNDEVLLLMLKEMYAQEGIHCDTCTDVSELMEMIRRKEYSLLLTDLNMPHINGFELLELLRSSNVGNSQTIPVVVATASGSCDAEELLERGFAGCLFKPFSISELMEVSDKCAIKAIQDSKPDFSALLSYGNETVMLEKLITETEKEKLAVRDAATRNDLQELDALTHHLRSSWEILRADQPLKVLYGVIHNVATPDDNTIQQAVNSVLDKGAEIKHLAKEERRKHKDG